MPRSEIPADEATAIRPGLPRRSLGLRLAWVTLVFCTLFIVLSVVLFTGLAWSNGRDRMQAELVQIE